MDFHDENIISVIICAVVKVKKKAHGVWPQILRCLITNFFHEQCTIENYAGASEQEEKLLLNGEKVNELFSCLLDSRRRWFVPNKRWPLNRCWMVIRERLKNKECSNAIVLLFGRQSKDTRMTCLNMCYRASNHPFQLLTSLPLRHTLTFHRRERAQWTSESSQ